VRRTLSCSITLLRHSSEFMSLGQHHAGPSTTHTVPMGQHRFVRPLRHLMGASFGHDSDALSGHRMAYPLLSYWSQVTAALARAVKATKRTTKLDLIFALVVPHDA
jgi:hypothetical protein